MKRALLAAALLLASCSLVVDVDSVRRERDGGILPGDSGTGAMDAGTSGSDASAPQDSGQMGFDAGPEPADGSTPGDGGPPPPCPGSSAPRLVCKDLQPFVGTQFIFPAVASLTGRAALFISADSSLQFAEMSSSGQVVTSNVLANGVYPSALSAAGRDDTWAVAWNPDGGYGVECRSSVSPTAARGMIAAAQPSEIAVSVSEGGAVGVAAVRTTFSTTLYTGFSDAGCPSGLGGSNELADRFPGVGLGHVRRGELGGFRVAYTARASPNSVVVLGDPFNSATRHRYVFAGNVGALASVAAEEDAGTQLMVYDYAEADGGAGLYAQSFRTNYTAHGLDRLIGNAVHYWNVATCGRGCTMTGMLHGGTQGRLSVQLLTDELDVKPIKAGAYDVACGVNASGGNSQLAVGQAGNKLLFFYTEGSQAHVYLCDPP